MNRILLADGGTPAAERALRRLLGGSFSSHIASHAGQTLVVARQD